jgi:hypothetical protein
MRTVIDLSPAAVADVAAWRATLDRNPFVARRLATAYTDALIRLLIDTKGRPASGRVDDRVNPPRYWHELTAGMWAEYVIDLLGPFFNPRREIRIFRLVPLPPHQSVPILPRS